MSSDAGSVSFALLLLLLPQCRSEPRARRPQPTVAAPDPPQPGPGPAPARRKGAALGVPGPHTPRAKLTPKRMLIPTWIGGGSVLDAERLPAICSSLFVSPPGEEEENGEKRKRKEAALVASPCGRRLRKSEAGGEILFTTNRLSRGISGSAKVHTGSAGGRGGQARRTLPGRAPPGRPSRSAGAFAAGVGVPLQRRESGPPFGLLPPPPLPRGAPGGRPRGGTRARAGLGPAPRSGPGSVGPLPGPRRRSAPFPAPRLKLPPGPRSRPLLPSQARGVRRRPATGGTCAPQIRIRETARAWP
ncbi:translation initiation factor IF-2-like [Camelus ferus]|uniref:Translation initiation factor IF-2-like n=1 Tax=Camelus ferus TaxID=419612 RepID=A0A8B8U1F4_CAMFR|nr:translation initiation factor IF-2-like [Camelus ferus]